MAGLARLRRKKGRRNIAEMNVVPYIDVMLVLLIIFMVTVPVLQEGVQVDLPSANASPVEVDEVSQPVVLSINKQGDFFLNLGANPAQSLDPNLLRVRVSAMLDINPQAKVLVKSDKTVPYATVVRAMALLQSAGVESIGLITSPDGS